MKKMNIAILLFLSLLLVGSNAESYNNIEVNKCPYIAKIQKSQDSNTKSLECPYIQSKVNSKSECPYLSESKVSGSKSSNAECPYSGKSKTSGSVMKSKDSNYRIILDKS